MKTKTNARIAIGLIAAVMFFPVILKAQNNVAALFNQEVIAAVQQKINLTTQAIGDNALVIQESQAIVAECDIVIADANSTPDDVTSAQNKKQMYLDLLTEYQDNQVFMQGNLTNLQSILATYQAYTEQQQKDFLLNQHAFDKVWLSTNFPGEPVHNPSNVFVRTEDLPNAARIESNPDANNPFFIPPFVSTNDAVQDAEIVHNWLVQQGLVKDDPNN